MDSMLIPTFFCPKAWESMPGHETTRFCSYCSKHVHNLEALSVSERLALLSSPAASICARYKIALRRPAPGKKLTYMRHMVKYGAGVALASSALLVLCEMYAENEKRTYYRAFAGMARVEPALGCTLGEWADEAGSDLDSPGTDSPVGLFIEQEVQVLGTIAFSDPVKITLVRPDVSAGALRHIDLNLDPVEINRLLQPDRPAAIELKPAEPLKNKKAGKRRLRGWGA